MPYPPLIYLTEPAKDVLKNPVISATTSAEPPLIPTSHVINLHGLAMIRMELALQNATNTISSIKSLLSVETLDPFALACCID
ncbi:hypothetical protein Tsubulata_028022 [Turnera subulata]|uniref:Uncharacterized protein n=1 Tax=Turnera subulata TaxID=218843 RepID=A0A9Q0G5G7_9ROSI|nr:hypothetical protein Tsubulata_028022 [Turnera subulata]